MKRKTAWIISMIAIPFLAAGCVLLAQTKDESRGGQDEKVRAETRMADEQSRIDAAKFDLQFTITDADGKPLNGVTMELERKRPRIPLLSGEWEKKTEKKTVDSKFRIQEKGWTGLDLRFLKDGYHLKQCKFDINILDKDKSKLSMRREIQVKMTEKSPLPSLAGSKGTLTYDFEKSSRNVIDIDIFPQKAKEEAAGLKKKEEMKSDAEEETEEEEEDVDEEEIIKEPETITVDFNAKPETVKYIELDFKRSEDGNIVYDTADTKGVAKPASCIVRFCSDDPGDGLLFVSKVEYPKYPEAEKELATAPEKGYKKEIAIDLGEKNKKFCVFCYIKHGNHYGKVMLWPVYIQEEKNKIQLVKMNVSISFNTLEGDHNVRSY